MLGRGGRDKRLGLRAVGPGDLLLGSSLSRSRLSPDAYNYYCYHAVPFLNHPGPAAVCASGPHHDTTPG